MWPDRLNEDKAKYFVTWHFSSKMKPILHYFAKIFTISRSLNDVWDSSESFFKSPFSHKIVGLTEVTCAVLYKLSKMRYSYYDTALSHISLDSALYCILLTTVPHSTQLELALSWIMLITVQDSTQLVLALSWIIPSTVPDSTQLDLVLSWIIISTIPDSTESFVIKLHYCMLLYCILYNITGTLYTVKKNQTYGLSLHPLLSV